MQKNIKRVSALMAMSALLLIVSACGKLEPPPLRKAVSGCGEDYAP